MAENSSIEWTDHTFNPWIGCTKVSPGCDHCYAEARMDARLRRLFKHFGWPVPNFPYESDASLIRVAGSCIGGLLTAVATRPTIVYGSSDPQLPPCFVCGTAFSQHGSFPTCATHPYTADATCSAVIGAACIGAECRNGCVRTRAAPSAAAQSTKGGGDGR